MVSLESPNGRAFTVQLRADLRQAHLELLSAECATNRLRTRYSAQDIARYAEPEVLRKVIATADALKDYYSSLEDQVAAAAGSPAEQGPPHSDERMTQAAARVLSYLQEQRERYSLMGIPLSLQQKTTMGPFFSPRVLEGVKIVGATGARPSDLTFESEAQAPGFVRVPEITHLPSLTFIDVIVLNEALNARELFHGLVQAVQFQLLGAERYADLFARSFFMTGSHVMVPLEAHAFILESRFAKNRSMSFSVEEQVLQWINESRY